MADVFAPKLSSDIRFNEPVEQPSMVGALADIAGGFLSALPRAGSTSSAKPKTDPNLAAFSEGLSRIQSVRDQKGELAAQVEERKLATNFAAAGINFDSDYQAVYEKTTGRPWTGYGADIEARTIQDTLAKPEVQANYIASFVVNPDWTEAERIDYAIGEQATMQFYRNEIEKSKVKADYTWSSQSDAAYNGAIDTFLNTNLGAVVATAQQGGRVGPQALANIAAQWSQMKVNLSRPKNVSDEQWKATQDKINNVDGMLATLTKAGSSEVLFEEITTALAGAIMKEGGGGPDAAVAAMMAIKNPDLLNNLGGLNVEGVIMKISKNLNLNLATPNLFGHILEDQGGLGGGTDPNAILKTLPADVEARIQGKTPQQIYNGLEASGLLTSMVTPNTIQGQDSRDQFVENAATIGAVLKGTNSDQFLSNDMLKKLIANPGFIANVKALDAIDPEAASVTRTYVRSGLDTERVKQAANLGSIENYLEGKGIVWSGADYVETDLAIRGRATATEINSEVIKQAKDRRSALATIESAMTALEVPVEGAKGSSSKPTSNIGAKLGIDFAAYEANANLPSGFLERTAYIESRGNVNAVSSTGATGLFQFTKGTARDFRLKNRNDPVQSTEAAVRLAVSNRNVLRNALGREPTGAELYLAHQQGAGGASSLLKNPTAKAVDIVGEQAVRVNGGDSNMTAGEFANLWLNKFNNAPTINTTQGTPANANSLAAAAGPAVQRAVTEQAAPTAPPVGVTTTPTAQPTATPVEAVAALPEQIPTPEQGGQQTQAQAPVVNAEVQAAIQELSSSPDQTYASDAEFLAAQQRGETSPGDTVIVDGTLYIIRKDGTAKRIGTVN